MNKRIHISGSYEVLVVVSRSLELSVVHMLFVLALFLFCSADERNARQHHDMSGHLQK
jgi:hypothetical protein